MFLGLFLTLYACLCKPTWPGLDCWRLIGFGTGCQNTRSFVMKWPTYPTFRKVKIRVNMSLDIIHFSLSKTLIMLNNCPSLCSDGNVKTTSKSPEKVRIHTYSAKKWTMSSLFQLTGRHRYIDIIYFVSPNNLDKEGLYEKLYEYLQKTFPGYYFSNGP